MKLKFLIGILITTFPTILGAGEKVIKDKQGMDCHVYTPNPIDPVKTYQLVVGVHGAGGKGKGAAGMASWTKRGDVIVIGPSFVSRQSQGGRLYQNGDGINAEKLIDLFKQLKTEYSLNEKMFIYGFSGGSQFAHRFTMNHPKEVCGVSAHSGGSWATDGFGKINSNAKKIPIAISCGEADTQKSFSEALYNRIDWFKKFRDEIDKKNFCYIADSWPGVGHKASAGVWDLTRQCFQIATGLPGGKDGKPVEISDKWKNLPDGAGGIRNADGSRPLPVPRVDEAALKKATDLAFKRADTEKILSAQLVTFMERYPPILWKEKEGAKQLLTQCEAAAKEWAAAARQKGMTNAVTQRRFEKFTQGLEIKF